MEGNGSSYLSGEERLLEAFDQAQDPPATTQAPKQKRSKFSPIRRKEVASIREKGACIKCHLGKIKCSGQYPCATCSEASPRRISKRGWMQCLPFSFKDVNIYALDSPCDQTLYKTIMERSSRCLITDNVEFDFHDELYWDLDTITRDFAQWMSNQQLAPPSTSRVGILSSFKLTRLLSTLVSDNMSQNFRLFVETSSALYNRGLHQVYAGYNAIELWRIRSFAGDTVLEGLQRVLNNKALSYASLFELKALFLILFGTIVSVGYSGQWRLSGSTDISRLSTRAFEAAQHQLIRILTYYMIEIADRLNLLDAQLSKHAIIKDANDQWKQKAAFRWDAPTASTARHDISGSMEFVGDQSFNHFFLLDQDLGQYVDETLYDFVRNDPVAGYLPEGITKGFLHDHRRRSSYVLSWPNTCTFMTNNSLPAIIKAYETQSGLYQRYQKRGGAWESDDDMCQLDPPSYSPPHNAGCSRTSSLHASCDACHSLLNAHGTCEQCILVGSQLPYTQGANDSEAPFFVARFSTPHVVSMQAYDMGSRLIDIDSDTDYTITETPPDLNTTFSQQPQLGCEQGSIDFEDIDDWVRDSSFARIGEWECNCALSTSHRQISLSTGEGRPLNLFV